MVKVCIERLWVLAMLARDKMAVVVLLLALLTLLVHRTALVRRVRVVGRVTHLSIALVDHATARRTILTRDLAIGSLVADRRELRTNTTAVGRGLSRLRRVGGTRGLDLVGLGSLGSGTLTLLRSFTLGFFLLLASLPFFANFLEF